MPRVPPPNTSLKPRKFFRSDACSNACSLGPGKLSGELPDIVHSWFEAGKNNEQIIELAARVGVHLSNGAIGRHRKNHLVPIDDSIPDPTNLKLEKVNELEALDQIIARGAQGIHHARITPELLLKAMDMKYKLTQGSAMESLLEHITIAMSGDDDEDDYLSAQEAAEARMSADEQAQGESVVE